MTEIKLNDVILYLIKKKRDFNHIIEEERDKKKSWSTHFRNAKSGVTICQELIDDLFVMFGGDKYE